MKMTDWLKGIFTQDHIESLARTALKAGGGALVAHGVVSADQWQGFAGVAVILLGLLFSLIDSVENPATAKSATPDATIVAKVGMWFLLGAVVSGLVGCASLDPGADPLVVRAEQAEAIAPAAFDVLLKVDDANRAFYRTNAPALHAFCEWLRTPVAVDFTNTLPRDLAFCKSLDNVKLAYKAGTKGSNDIVTAILTLEQAINETQKYISLTSTNQ